MPKKLSEADVLDAVRVFICKQGSQRKAARVLSVSASYLTQVLQSGRVGVKIPHRLGLRYVEGHYETA